MKKSKIVQNSGINLGQLENLVKANPQYTKMFTALAQVDNTIKKFAEDIVCNKVDSSLYYLKTEIDAQCYSLYLYNQERNATVGVSWPLVDFLQMCRDKRMEVEMNTKITKMLLRFEDTNLDTANTNWIY